MSRKILTVDDSATVRFVLAKTLRDAGYDVLEACDGQEALDCLEHEKVSMLITDLNMPKVDGINLIRRVRRSDGFRFVPIIMLTTESEESRKQEGKAAGASGWVLKPLRPEQLLAVVNMVMC